ncbi:uncharacterized protein BO96DRAFT_439098 [Aspergillus niger CBS 101883]|uniref:Uncharacterized protein n=2 Tax=Aspergillus niger TaxID=5061 RepID=A2QUG3_ASPNC|nr:uncharacterized protein BO96DRAFT_439098 [Aspergillus niger CBS 101883]XP_059606955.1 hypothetical protein An09g05560 [Aspergillus niger]PYH51308.1 hypothetical protein BO96DRAFT_439098 [Aspergillus niger CBS 101883]CAL00832.1 hypothetical protein An09g05560 [Aspergillus niger]
MTVPRREMKRATIMKSTPGQSPGQGSDTAHSGHDKPCVMGRFLKVAPEATSFKGGGVDPRPTERKDFRVLE